MKPLIGHTAPVRTPCTLQDLGIGMVVQEWCRCPYEWGLDHYITMDSSQGKVILCKVTYEHRKDGNEVYVAAKSIKPLYISDIPSV